MNLPLQGFDQNRIWCAIVALAVEITAWMQMLALSGHQARRREPKRLRLPLFTLPASIARTGRQVRLHLATKAPWVDLVNEGIRGCEPSLPRAGNTPPVPTTTARPGPPATGAHPRRHPGHRHTPMAESTPAGDLQPQRRSTPNA
jgi:hypothetical protein